MTKAGSGNASDSSPRKVQPDELKALLAGAAIAFFFTQGLPLWNDDYSQWLEQAKSGVFALLGRILLPVTSEPQAWGYSDRPLEVLIFKILHGIFGTWGTAYYFVKSLVFGALCAAMFRWLRQLGVARERAAGVLLVFALSANTVASLVWHSDFGVHSQLVLALLLPYAAREIEGAAYRSRRYWRFVATFFAAVYFGSKLKGDVRLAPVILLAYLAIFDRKRLKAFAAPLAVSFLATLPWSGKLFASLPPFLGGTDYTGWTYGTFSVSRVFSFLFGGALSVREPSMSLVSAAGLLTCLAALAYGGFRAYESRLGAPDRKTGLPLIWLGVMAVACGMIAAQNPTFQLRYTIVLLVPATLLLGRWLEDAARDFGKERWFKPAALALLALQCGLQLWHASGHRRDMGHTIVAVDRVFTTVETRFANAQFVLQPGYLGYGFRDSAAPALRNRKPLKDINELGQYPAGNTVAASWSPTLDARLVLDTAASGCAASLFDLVFACSPLGGAFIHRYVGEVPELAQADALDKRGDLKGAQALLDGYLQREPRNLGVAFVAGLYAYRQGNFARMEQVYGELATYFPTHLSVIYNAALAKQGVQKFDEARKLFEKAYAQAPKDYGIGFNLADTYYRLGKKSRALATVDELLQAYPNHPALSRAKQDWGK